MRRYFKIQSTIPSTRRNPPVVTQNTPRFKVQSPARGETLRLLHKGRERGGRRPELVGEVQVVLGEVRIGCQCGIASSVETDGSSGVSGL